ncbi:hypothetical protein WJX75_004518 [Coccomyxa subellipsoidea]|uniref:Uncharacterized protein n=1 Tax=Coccomyxa subellipsoidea TaxID=248742 RepID=A0ABR2YVD1_9CHLO
MTVTERYASVLNSHPLAFLLSLLTVVGPLLGGPVVSVAGKPEGWEDPNCHNRTVDGRVFHTESFLITNLSFEGMTAAMDIGPGRLLWILDEWRTLISTFGKANAAAKDVDMAIYFQTYSGSFFSKRLKNHTLVVENTGLGVLGFTQPEQAFQALHDKGLQGSGFIARQIFLAAPPVMGKFKDIGNTPIF